VTVDLDRTNPRDQITAKIRRNFRAISAALTEHYNARACADAVRLARVEGRLARLRARRDELITARAAVAS